MNQRSALSTTARLEVAAGRLPALDGLRGLAVLAIVLRHWWESIFSLAWDRQDWLHGPLAPLLAATAWVHLLFVLSGFVLTGSLERSRGAGNLVQYAVRRFFRLYPPFICAAFFTWVVSALYSGSPAGSGVTNWVRMIVAIRPDFAALLSSLLLPGTAAGLLPMGWSLTIEVVFSALLPLMCLLARRLHWSALLGGALLALWIPGSPGELLNTRGLFLCSADFAFGIGLWLERERLARLLQGRNLVASLIGVVGVFLIGWPTAARWAIHLPTSVAFLTLGSVALMVAAEHCAPLRRGLECRPLLFTGRVSYSLYLLHIPVLFLLAPRIVRDGGTAGEAVLLLALLLIISLLLSALSFRWIERPSIELGNRLVHQLAHKLGVAERLSRL